MTQEEFKKCTIDLNYLLDCAELTSYSKKLPEDISNLCSLRQNVNDFEMIRSVGKGGYGQVYLVRNRENGALFALKIIKKKTILDFYHLALFKNEKAALKAARNTQFLVSMYSCFQNKDNIFFLMDYCPLELINLLPVTDISEITFYAANLLLAIEELHALGFVHRDIKPDNIFIGTDGYLKLADFGSCCKFEDLVDDKNQKIEFSGNRSTNSFRSMSSESSTRSRSGSEFFAGTPDYVAPELFSHETGYESDIWSYGVVVYEIMHDITPFWSDSLYQTQQNIQNIQYEKPKGEFGNFLDSIFRSKDQRASIQQLKDHDFLKNIHFKNFKNKNKPFRIPKIDTKEENVNIDSEIIEKTFKFVGFSYDPTFDNFEVDLQNKHIEKQNLINLNDKTLQMMEKICISDVRCDDQCKKECQKTSIDIGKIELQNMNEICLNQHSDTPHSCFTSEMRNENIFNFCCSLDRVLIKIQNLKSALFKMQVFEQKYKNLQIHQENFDKLKSKYNKIKSENADLLQIKSEYEKLKSESNIETAIQNVFSLGSKKKQEQKIISKADDFENNLEDKLPQNMELAEKYFTNPIKLKQSQENVKKLEYENEQLRKCICKMKNAFEEKDEQFSVLQNKIQNVNYQCHMSLNEIRKNLRELDFKLVFNQMKDEIRELKRSIKQKEKEKREMQFQNSSEVDVRRKLEKQLLKYKTQIQSLKSRMSMNYKFSVKIADKRTDLKISDGNITFLKIVERINNCVFANLSKAEKQLYKRKHVVKLIFIDEDSPSASFKRKKGEILEDIEKEKKLMITMERLLLIHKDEMKERTKVQLEGCINKIKYLETELKNVDENESDDAKVGITGDCHYDGHVFFNSNDSSGYCYFCDEPHYSNSLHCALCGINVHKHCYTLVMSCSMCQSVEKGKSFLIEMKNSEEMTRLKNILRKES